MYRDDGLAGYDAATAVEVVEHLDPSRLDAFARGPVRARPPVHGRADDAEPRVQRRFPGLPAGALRHRDHRFEWTPGRAAVLGGRGADAHGYRVRYLPVGPEDPSVGPPTQMAVVLPMSDTTVPAATRIEVPRLALVVLVGMSGSGKSTFAHRWFRATEVLSSDAFRAMSPTTSTTRPRPATRSTRCTTSPACACGRDD